MARPKAFDPDRALDDAMEVFWQKGYDATSVQDLVDRMQINRASMYATFGDKHTLFLATLDRYYERVNGRALARLETPTASLSDIEAFFEFIVENQISEAGRMGCYLVNTAAEKASSDAEARERVELYLDRMEIAFRSALQNARARGEVNGGLSLESRARFLSSCVAGLFVVGKGVPDEARLRDTVAVALAAIA